jgi:hypothetical protein
MKKPKTQFVVINRCFGGFSLSPKAVLRLAQLQGKEVFFFKHEFANGQRILVPVLDIRGTEDSLFWTAYTVPNPDEVAGRQDENWHSMSLEERQASNKRWDDISLTSRPENRSDPLLIQVVRELGEEADGTHAELKIVEIPADVEYEISEYDGMESVEEVHRSWN